MGRLRRKHKIKPIKNRAQHQKMQQPIQNHRHDPWHYLRRITAAFGFDIPITVSPINQFIYSKADELIVNWIKECYS